MSQPLPSTAPMYGTILVTLDTRPTDRAIIRHVKQLARAVHTRRVVLLHVADGWAARTYGPEAVSPEISEDTAYLREVRTEFEADGIAAEVVLAFGDPASEIVSWVEREGCDLVAMSTHGHKGVQDLIRGSVANEVRHKTTVPVLMVRGTPRKLRSV